jgi:hypothetical protein
MEKERFIFSNQLWVRILKNNVKKIVKSYIHENNIVFKYNLYIN